MKSDGERLLDLLTICRKAGKLEIGFDAMKEALEKGKAQAVVTAADISPKTEKEARFFADKQNTPVLKTALSMEEIGLRLGKRAGILTVCESGFAKRAAELCGGTAEEKTE